MKLKKDSKIARTGSNGSKKSDGAVAANTSPKQKENKRFNDLINKVMKDFYTVTPQN